MIAPMVYADIPVALRRTIREQYARQQRGLCFHCKESLDAPPPKRITAKKIDWSKFPRGRGFLMWPQHLHHSHETGLTIGTVHAYCNAVLFQYHGE